MVIYEGQMWVPKIMCRKCHKKDIELTDEQWSEIERADEQDERDSHTVKRDNRKKALKNIAKTLLDKCSDNEDHKLTLIWIDYHGKDEWKRRNNKMMPYYG